VDAFDLLHPGLQHHVVNSLGWRELRPIQEDVIPVVLRGDHVVIVARLPEEKQRRLCCRSSRECSARIGGT